MTRDEHTTDRIADLARDYVRARRAHADAMREALMRAMRSASGWVAVEGVPPPPDLGHAIVAEDGVPLTVGGEEPDGVFRWRARAASSVTFDRAERRLRAALEAGALGPVADAARAVFNDAREPFYSYAVDERGEPVCPDEKRRVDERIARHTAVFDDLERCVDGGR